MQAGLRKTPRLGGHPYSIQTFIKRVIATLIALLTVSSTVIFLLVYLPLTVELEKSLMENFGQLSFIRYVSLQNSIDRGMEGARSLSSRTVIRNAIIEYENGEINIDELIEATQSRYEDGTKALEYLIKAERSVDETVIAEYLSEKYKNHVCATDDRLVKSNAVSSALCLTDDHAYFVILSPLLSEGLVLGYDKLIFDLTGQIRMLGTSTMQSEMIYHGEFKNLVADANIIQSDGVSYLFYKNGLYYQAFYMQDLSLIHI